MRSLFTDYAGAIKTIVRLVGLADRVRGTAGGTQYRHFAGPPALVSLCPLVTVRASLLKTLWMVFKCYFMAPGPGTATKTRPCGKVPVPPEVLVTQSLNSMINESLGFSAESPAVCVDLKCKFV